MSSWSTSVATQTRRRVDRLRRREAPRLAWLARAGYAAQGVLYATIGALAVLAAANASGVETEAEGRTTTSRGALAEIGAAPFGRVLLVLLALGLAGYAAWRLVQAVWNPEGEAKPGPKGLARRAGWLGVALVHASLVVFALRAAIEGASGPEDQTRPLTARVLAFAPLGPLLVLAGGVGLFAFGAYEVWRAWKVELDRELDLRRVPSGRAHALVALSRFGIAARGVVFSMMGVFLVVAAATTDAAEARGFGEALGTFSGWTFGTVLLGAVALGLVAYGAYDATLARYRRIRPA